MPIVLGFDPGGIQSFGWCVSTFAPDLPLHIVTYGLKSNARDAVRAAIAAVPEGEQVLAAGIDSPLCWTHQGDRASDQAVRAAIHAARRGVAAELMPRWA